MSRQRSDRDLTASTVVVAVSFLLSSAGAVVFAITYALGPDRVGPTFNQLLGLTSALAVGGLGVGLVSWAHGLMSPGPHIEERDTATHHPRERRELAETARSETQEIGRRSLLGRLLIGALGLTGLAALFPLRSLGPAPFPARLRTGYERGRRLVNEEGEPVEADGVDFNSFVTVFPEGRVREADSQTMLLRLSRELVEAAPNAGDWTPEGFIAYSKVCTHAGCPVGLFQVETLTLLCPCHQSAFDVTDGARPRFGPATRPLPRLPIAVDDEGFIVAEGEFEQPVGPGFWSYPRQAERRRRARDAEGSS